MLDAIDHLFAGARLVRPKRGRIEVQLLAHAPGRFARQTNDGVAVDVRLTTLDPDGTPRDIKECEAVLVPSGSAISRERVVAFLEAWLRIVPVRLELEAEPESLMPHDVLSPWILDQATDARTSGDYERALVASWGAWLPGLASALADHR